MKKIYIHHNGASLQYFSTLKKLHNFLLSSNKNVQKPFAEFKKWITQDGIYQISVDGITEFCTIEKVN